MLRLKTGRICYIIVILLLCLNGCSSGNSLKDLECNPAFIQGAANITESENVVYFRIGMQCGQAAKLCYFEKSTGNNGVLCSKAECLHDDETCDGWVGGVMDTFGFSACGGRLYYLFDGYDSLSEANLTEVRAQSLKGGSRKSVQEIYDQNDLASGKSLPTGNLSCFFHKGYAFCLGSSDIETVSGEIVHKLLVKGFDLSESGKEIEIESLELSGNEAGVVLGVPDGDMLWYLLFVADLSSGVPENLHVTVKTWNINTGTTTIVFDGDPEIANLWPNRIWVENDSLLLSSYEDSRIYQLDKSGNMTTKLDFSDQINASGVYFGDDKIILDEGIGGKLAVFDFNGTLLTEISEGLDGFRMFYGSDDAYIYYDLFDPDTLSERLAAISIKDGTVLIIGEAFG